jgi:RNA polymerase sigma-70 factor (ECF subfamily)
MTDSIAARVQPPEVQTEAMRTGENGLARQASSPSFREIYDAHADMVLRTLRRHRVPSAHVEDVAQEVFLSVHRGLAHFEARASLRTWVYRIARNAALNHRRDHRREDGAIALEEDDHAVQTADPERAVQASEARNELEAILSTLDEERREVLVLTELEGFTAPEIAELARIPVNTVYSRLRLARVDFEQALARRRARLDGA